MQLVSYKKQELPILREHHIPPDVFVGSVLLVALLSCVVLLCVFIVVPHYGFEVSSSSTSLCYIS